MSVDPRIGAWREAGKHLPPALRDFHDQKDVFKLVHHLTAAPQDSRFNHPSWRDGQVYVIDTFLWCMARHGYTLQRSRTGLPFEDLHQNIAAMRAQEMDVMSALISTTGEAPK